jgi:hypothetical protein
MTRARAVTIAAIAFLSSAAAETPPPVTFQSPCESSPTMPSIIPAMLMFWSNSVTTTKRLREGDLTQAILQIEEA